MTSEKTKPENKKENLKRPVCFVVGPIGDAGTGERNAADWLLRYVIKPVLEDAEFGFEVIRADEYGQPGMITAQVIGLVMNSELVIADLTDNNPNAFYELAIRHMEERKTIHMFKAGQLLPFDVKDYRSVPYTLGHPDDLDEAKNELRKQVRAVLAADYKVTNPITHARGHRKLAGSSDPAEKIIADLVDAQAATSRRVDMIGMLIRDFQRRVGGLEASRASSFANSLFEMQNAALTPPGAGRNFLAELARTNTPIALDEGGGTPTTVTDFPYTPPEPKKPGSTSR